MVGETKIYSGQRVQVMGIVNGDEVVVQLPDGKRKPVYRSELSDVPAPQSNRPIITKGAVTDPNSDAAADAAHQGALDAEKPPTIETPELPSGVLPTPSIPLVTPDKDTNAGETITGNASSPEVGLTEPATPPPSDLPF